MGTGDITEHIVVDVPVSQLCGAALSSGALLGANRGAVRHRCADRGGADHSSGAHRCRRADVGRVREEVVSQIQEQTDEVVEVILQEHVSERAVEQVMGVLIDRG